MKLFDTDNLKKIEMEKLIPLIMDNLTLKIN
jgi:hypothetical protein